MGPCCVGLQRMIIIKMKLVRLFLICWDFPKQHKRRQNIRNVIKTLGRFQVHNLYHFSYRSRFHVAPHVNSSGIYINDRCNTKTNCFNKYSHVCRSNRIITNKNQQSGFLITLMSVIGINRLFRITDGDFSLPSLCFSFGAVWKGS